MDLKKSLEARVKVDYYVLDYTAQQDLSFLEKYDIGLLINKIGFFDPNPALFIERDVDYFLDHNLRGPLILIKWVLRGMVDRNFGYIINIGFCHVEKPRPFYTLISSVKAMFKSWSANLYYELKGYKINIEYMDVGNIALNDEEPSWLNPDPDKFAASVFSIFGNSYYTVPHFSHFIEYLFIKFLPLFIVARYRKAKLARFSKKVRGLY